MRARDIIEAEDPKSVFRQATENDQAFDYVDRIFQRNTEWEPFGSSHGWALEYQDYSDDIQQPPVKWLMVWWDAEAQEWVMKIEGQRRHFGRWGGRHQFGLRTFKSGRALIDALRQRRHLFMEAEDPKTFLRRVSAGEMVRNRRSLRNHIAAILRQVPERTQANLGEWYFDLDHNTMPKIMKALEGYYKAKAPDGTRGLLRTWVGSDDAPERLAVGMIMAFEANIDRK